MKHFIIFLLLSCYYSLSAQQGGNKEMVRIVYSTDTCELENPMEGSLVVKFGAGFDDSLKITQGDTTLHSLHVRSNTVTGMSDDQFVLPRQSAKIVISTFHDSCEVITNIGFKYIIVSHVKNEWVLLYTNCPPLEE